MTEKTEDSALNEKLEELMERNADLLEENNKLLRKMHRNNVVSFWLRMLWFATIIGLPFLLYFYVIEPYFEAFGSNYEVFKAGIGEIPGFKGIDSLLDSMNGS